METFMVTFMAERKSKNLSRGTNHQFRKSEIREPTKHQLRGFMVPTMKG